MKTASLLAALILSELMPVILSGQAYPQSAVSALKAEISKADPKTGIQSITVKNISTVPILEYCVGDPDSSNVAWNWGMEPGESRTFSNAHFVIRAALFTDGTYEGDTQAAAQMADSYVGQIVQFERIEKLVDNVISAPGTDIAKRDAILRDLNSMADEADAVVVNRLKKDFPSLAGPHQDDLAYMKQGMWSVTTDALINFQHWPDRASGRSLAQWWAFLKQPGVTKFHLDYVPTPTPGIEAAPITP